MVYSGTNAYFNMSVNESHERRAHLLRNNYSRNFSSIRSEPVSHLANEFDVRSELHGQVRLAAVNQIVCRS